MNNSVNESKIMASAIRDYARGQRQAWSLINNLDRTTTIHELVQARFGGGCYNNPNYIHTGFDDVGFFAAIIESDKVEKVGGLLPKKSHKTLFGESCLFSGAISECSVSGRLSQARLKSYVYPFFYELKPINAKARLKSVA